METGFLWVTEPWLSWARFVEQAGPELTAICLPLPPPRVLLRFKASATTQPERELLTMKTSTGVLSLSLLPLQDTAVTTPSSLLPSGHPVFSGNVVPRASL